MAELQDILNDITAQLKKLRGRVEALEQNKTLTDKLLKDYGSDEDKFKVDADGVGEEKKEPLSVDDICDAYDSNSGEWYMKAQQPKMNAFGKLLIIEHHVNAKHPETVAYCHPVTRGADIDQCHCFGTGASPLSIKQKAWGEFINTPNIIPLIKEYLS